jgi:ribosomal-protein-serine acetyltransferase
MMFAHDLGGGAELVLRTLDIADEMHEITVRNLDRLRRWEPWAHGDQSPGDSRQWARVELDRFLRGEAVPTAIRHHGAIVGAASSRFDAYTGCASLGYWIDAEAEGRGLVTRACRVLVLDAFERGAGRIEIRTASGNERSIAVAERLGFAEEGLLRSALPVGGRRHDVVVFGKIAGGHAAP